MRIISSWSHEAVLKDDTVENSSLYEDAKVKYRVYEKQPKRYYLPPGPQTTFQSPLSPRFSLNVLELGNRSDSRKSVRFSEQIGCRQIPCAESQEIFVGKFPDKIKAMRSFHIPTMVFEDNKINQSQGLLCLPKMNKRRRSVNPIETAVWNSGRQLRQYIPSPSVFRRITEFPSNLLRGHYSWRSQPSLESRVGKNRTPAINSPDSAIDMMETVYVSDSEDEYEWETSPYDFDGYENPSNLLSYRDKLIQNQVYEPTNPDEDYEFDEYDIPRAKSHMLKEHDYAKSWVVDNLVNNFQSIYELPPSPKAPPKKTALQDRIAQSFNRLSIPEWMQKKLNGFISSKPTSRLPRFSRYIDPYLTHFREDLSKISPLLIRR